MSYYDGTKLLSMLDINGNKPEVYLCTTNRNGGKTTYFNRWVVNRFLKYGEKFALIYRFNYELDDVEDKFFKDIQGLFFSEYEMSSERKANGIYRELYLNDKMCGYGITLNSADVIKKYSHMFSDVQRMLFDEFQSETNHYCANEIQKLFSVHTSVARGQGKQVRYVPIIMISNTVSIINPYYVTLGISSRLNNKTKFLRGDGFVLENGFIESASEAQLQSGFNRAFAKSKYSDYATQAVYLNDDVNFIEKPQGKSNYVCTIKYQGKNYGVRCYNTLGILYCDDKPDMNFPIRIVGTTADHAINYIMLRKNELTISQLRYTFERGRFRFKDMLCKDAIINTICYGIT